MYELFHDKLLIGRHEWCGLPDLNIPAIKGKIDTGARTSAIHAENIVVKKHQHQHMVEFDVFPLQANEKISVHCRAPLIDERYVMSSNGHRELRCIIKTTLHLGSFQWEMELALSNRDPLKYRLLLGRESLNRRVIIDPSLTCHLKHIKKSQLELFYSSK
ncbi:MAG: RimK/LysX family protein [Legionellales bacterium]|nr:RimK/LysX family protein [Legionellales bacterium]